MSGGIRTLLAVVLSTGGSLMAAPLLAAQELSSGRLIEAARAQIDVLNTDSAATLLLQALDPRRSPSAAERVRALVLLGITELVASRPDGARHLFREALTLDPTLRVDSLAQLHAFLLATFDAERNAALSNLPAGRTPNQAHTDTGMVGGRPRADAPAAQHAMPRTGFPALQLTAMPEIVFVQFVRAGSRYGTRTFGGAVSLGLSLSRYVALVGGYDLGFGNSNFGARWQRTSVTLTGVLSFLPTRAMRPYLLAGGGTGKDRHGQSAYSTAYDDPFKHLQVGTGLRWLLREGLAFRVEGRVVGVFLKYDSRLDALVAAGGSILLGLGGR